MKDKHIVNRADESHDGKPSLSVIAALSRVMIPALVLAEAGAILTLAGFMIWAKFKSGSSYELGRQLIDVKWGFLNTLTLVVGSLALALGVVAVRLKNNAATVLFIALTIICGVDFLGVKLIEYSRAWNNLRQFNLAELRGASTASGQQPAAGSQQEITPDPAIGSQLYEASCASCHGAEGLGVARQGAALRDSEFVAGMSVDDLAEFLKQGRQPADPQSVMRMVMPPRGGNPMLTDQELIHIAAFVKQLNSGEAAVPAAPVQTAFKPHRSNIPPAPSGPGGLKPEYISQFNAHEQTAKAGAPGSQARPAVFYRFFLIFTSLHAAHVFLITLILVGFMLYPLSRRITTSYQEAFTQGALIWHAAVLVWFFIFPMLYWLF